MSRFQEGRKRVPQSSVDCPDHPWSLKGSVAAPRDSDGMTSGHHQPYTVLLCLLAVVLDREGVVPPQRLVREELLLLRNVSAVHGHRHERGVPLDAPSGRKVNFKPQAVAAGRPGHPAEGRGFARRHSRVSVQGNFKGDSSSGRAVGGEKNNDTGLSHSLTLANMNSI